MPYTQIQDNDIPPRPPALLAGSTEAERNEFARRAERHDAGRLLSAAVKAAESRHQEAKAAADEANGHLESIAAARNLLQAIVEAETLLSGQAYANDSSLLPLMLRRAGDEARQHLEAAGEPIQDPSEVGATVLSSLIARLDSAKAQAFADLFMVEEPSQESFLALFTSGKQPDDDWIAYLVSHAITKLSIGNIINFQSRSLVDGSIEVVKLEWRLDMPRTMDRKARAALGSLLLPSTGSRMVSAVDPEGRNSARTLMITSFCNGGSADSYLSIMRENHHTRLLSIMTQMAFALQQMEDHNFYFPDAKISNWLIHNGQLRIADTKSFLRTTQGLYDPYHPDNRGCRAEGTRLFCSTEIYTNNPPLAKNVHSAILGRNLYFALTGEVALPDSTNPDADNQPLKLPATAMNKPQAIAYNALIQALTKAPAHTRMTSGEAAVCLSQIAAIEAELAKWFTLTNSDFSVLVSQSIQTKLEADLAISQAVNDVLQSLQGITVGACHDANALFRQVFRPIGTLEMKQSEHTTIHLKESTDPVVQPSTVRIRPSQRRTVPKKVTFVSPFNKKDPEQMPALAPIPSTETTGAENKPPEQEQQTAINISAEALHHRSMFAHTDDVQVKVPNKKKSPTFE